MLVVDQYDMSSLEVLFSGAAPLGASLTVAVSLIGDPKNRGLLSPQGHPTIACQEKREGQP
jgi:hypothetical protein